MVILRLKMLHMNTLATTLHNIKSASFMSMKIK